MPKRLIPPAQAPTPAQSKAPTQPPRTAFPGHDYTKPPELIATPAPGEDIAQAQGGGVEGEGEVPFSQATYYTCVTRGGTYTHCGWHMPVVWVGEAGAGGLRGGREVVVGVVGIVVWFIMF